MIWKDRQIRLLKHKSAVIRETGWCRIHAGHPKSISFWLRSEPVFRKMGFEKHRIFEQSDQLIFAKPFVCWMFFFWFWGSGLTVVLWALFETVQGCQTFNSFSPYGGDRTGTFGWWILVDREIAAASAHLRPAIKRVMDTIAKTTNSQILGEDSWQRLQEMQP